jgi:hypothetical protein
MTKSSLGSAWLFRVGGLALLTGSAAFVVHLVLRSVVTAGSDLVVVAQAASWAPINTLGLVAAVLVLLGMPAMIPLMLDSGGRATLLGLALLAAAWMFFGLFLSLFGLLVVPWLADQAPWVMASAAPRPPAFLATFGIGLLNWITGTVLVAIPFIRHRAGPTWVGYVVLASSFALVVGNLLIAPSGPASNLGLNLLSNTGPMLLLSGIGYLGFRLWSEHPTLKANVASDSHHALP